MKLIPRFRKMAVAYATETPRSIAEMAHWLYDNDLKYRISRDQNAANHATPISGVRQIGNELNRALRCTMVGEWEIDAIVRPVTFRYIGEDIDVDALALDIPRDELERKGLAAATPEELFRIKEIERIRNKLKQFCGICPHIEHAQALKNPTNPGSHHPDNMQLVIGDINRMKGNSNLPRMTWEQQESHLRHYFLGAMYVWGDARRLDENIFETLLAQLKAVY